jgi:hypothetical protein
MSFNAALVREQGVSFAVVAVKPHVFNSRTEQEEVSAGFQTIFPGYNIVLMRQVGRGRTEYYGRTDIVNFLSKLFVEQLPWKSYSYN